ncbi:MAG: MFS transporter [Clostridia bacterium]|nr:MFS transporter [Clostridia bacterium]
MNSQRKFDYKWLVIAACFAMIFTCLGFCSSIKPLVLSPISAALGIDRSVYSINDSLRYISTAVVNVFFGFLVGRFGARKMIAEGFLCMTASSLCYALAPNVWVLYLGGILLGTGLSWTTTTMVGYVVNKWSKKNKGTVMGAVLAANGFGGALVTQIFDPIINADPLGYKTAYFIISAIVFCVGVVVVLLVREQPKIMEAQTEIATKKRGRTWDGLAFSEILKKPYFWVACVAIFMTGVALNGVTSTVKAHMSDVRVDAAFATLVVTIASITLAGFKFLAGILYDRFGLRFTSGLCSVSAVAVMIAMSLLTKENSAAPIGMALAMSYTVFGSLALPLETVMLPIYTGDLFGERAYNKLLGIIVSVNTAGYAIGNFFMNLSYDLMGSYRVGYLVAASAMVCILLSMQFVITATNRERKRLEQKATAPCSIES